MRETFPIQRSCGPLNIFNQEPLLRDGRVLYRNSGISLLIWRQQVDRISREIMSRQHNEGGEGGDGA